MQRRRVVITGVGLVTPIGTGRDEYWKAALEGKSGIKKIAGFDTSNFLSKIAGQISGFEPSTWINRKKLKYMSRSTQLAVVAAKLAIEDSGLKISDRNQDNIGIYLGTSTNAMSIIEEQLKNLSQNGPHSVNPLGIAMSSPSTPASNLSVELNLKGETFTVSTGCSSSTNAIGLALRGIQTGTCNKAVAGGVDAPITPLLLSGFGNARFLSNQNEKPEEASRPFDRYRDGYVLSEGAGIIILEEYSSAVARRAEIYAELAGYACLSDGYSTFRLEPDGAVAVKTIKAALKDARVNKKDVDYFNAHGSSSVVSDRRETKVIKEVFNSHSSKLQVSSIKSMIGQPLGASGAIQTATCALTIKEKAIPPTINYEEADPECDLDYVPNEARESDIEVAVNNCLGIGGNNSCIVLKKCRTGY